MTYPLGQSDDPFPREYRNVMDRAAERVGRRAEWRTAFPEDTDRERPDGCKAEEIRYSFVCQTVDA